MKPMATVLDRAGCQRLVLAVMIERLNPGFRVRRPSLKDRGGRMAASIWRTLRACARGLVGCVPPALRVWVHWPVEDRVMGGAFVALSLVWLWLCL